MSEGKYQERFAEPDPDDASEGERQALRTYGIGDRARSATAPREEDLAGHRSDDPVPDPFEGLPAEPVHLRILEDDFKEIGTLAGLAELYNALCRAQATFPPIPKNRTAKIQPREGKGAAYTFDFADLDTVISATRPSLTREGIAVIAPPAQIRDGLVTLRTIVARGEARLESTTKFAYAGDIKAMGGAITYHRRYVYQGIFNVSADADADEVPGPNDESGSGGPRQRPAAAPGAPEPEHRPSERPAARAPHGGSQGRSEPPPVPGNAARAPATENHKSEINQHMRRLKWTGQKVAQEYQSLTGQAISQMTAEGAERFLAKLRVEKAP